MSDAKNVIEEHEKLQEENGTLTELLEEANAKISEVAKQSEVLSEKVESLQNENKELSEELDKANEASDELRVKVEELTQEEDALETKVSETLNEIGVEPVSLDSNLEEVDHLAVWGKITNPSEKTKYYRENKEKILGGNN